MAGLLAQLKALGLSDAQIAATTIDGKPFHEVEVKKQPIERMNKLEAQYSWFLDGLIKADKITRYRFGSVKVRLADKTWYAPDFQVWTPDGAVIMIETKGWCRDDAAVKFKVAREHYQEYKWMMLGKKSGKWRFIMGDEIVGLVP